MGQAGWVGNALAGRCRVARAYGDGLSSVSSNAGAGDTHSLLLRESRAATASDAASKVVEPAEAEALAQEKTMTFVRQPDGRIDLAA